MPHYAHLSLLQREEILRHHSLGETQAAIASALGLSQPTISRELRRGYTSRGYCPLTSSLRAASSRRDQARLLDRDEALLRDLARHLRDRRSVRQALALLAKEDPERALPSHESVYLWLYAADDPLRTELRSFMIRPRKRRRRRRRSDTRGVLVGMVPLARRDPEAESRKSIGHWEGDLIIGARGQSALATLVERSSRLTLLVRIPSRRSEDVVRAVGDSLLSLPVGSVKSLVWDQGKEMAEHARLAAEIAAPVYFAEAHSPWQRGSNENTNGVLRRWLPKGTDLDVGGKEVRRIQGLVNTRPMPVLSGRSPAEVFTSEYALQT